MNQNSATFAIRRRASPRPTLLVFEISAKIAKPDIEAMAKDVEAAFDAHDKIDMLLIMTDFEGMDADAAFRSRSLGRAGAVHPAMSGNMASWARRPGPGP